MMSKVKNLIIFVSIGVVFALVYIYFIKGDSADLNLTTTPSSDYDAGVAPSDPAIAGEFLGLLLSVKNIKLNDTIFSEPAFMSLHDSSIVLVPDGNEGRPNPFAPIGTDIAVNPVTTTPVITPAAPTSTSTPPTSTPPSTPTTN